MKRMTLLLLASTIGVATACGNTADGAKEDTKNAAEATSEAAASAGASMDGAADDTAVGTDVTSGMSRFSLRCFRPLLLGAALIALPSNVFAWGDAGHRLTGLAAAQKLPDDMPAFFRAASQRLAYLNPEPDRWKDRAESALDPALTGGTSPDHYIDMDLAAPAVLASALRSANRYGFGDTLRTVGIAASTMGLLPFAILEQAQRLRGHFRLWRIAPDSATRSWIEARIIDDAGLLGHYIADGSNPAHTTKHHNGWVGENPKSYATDNRFHSRFESAYVQAHITLPDVIAGMTNTPRVFPDLRAAVIAYLSTTFTQLDRLYEIDKRTPWQPASTNAEQKAFASERLAAGAEMLRDVWYTAWITSAPIGAP